MSACSPRQDLRDQIPTLVAANRSIDLRRDERKAIAGSRQHQGMICRSFSHTGRHLLVVEPDPRFRLLLCVATVGEFSDFHAVASYYEARALFAEHDFAAIIAENDLPGGTGLLFYEEVRRLRPELPFVLMCGGIAVTRDDPQFRFFAKPFSIGELTATLAELTAFVGGR